MTQVVLVDWLGRGGIAQTSREWVDAVESGGRSVEVVTRRNRELAGRGAPDGVGRIGAHRRVASFAATVVREQRPRVVVVQNYVLPLLERPVFAAAQEVGARVVVVVHDHQLHSVAAGTRFGLRTALRRADVVVAHSNFVGDALRQWTGRPVVHLPLPVLHSVVDAANSPSPFQRADERLLALHFGVLKRGYKGTQQVLDIAARRPPGWRFGLLGAGSPTQSAGSNVEVVSGYVEHGALAAAVRSSAATLLPYRIATQSGAVALAQALGSVAVATAVGGIPEQIQDGVTGLLLPPNSSTVEWLDALESLCDAGYRRAFADRSKAYVYAQHAAFERGVRELVG